MRKKRMLKRAAVITANVLLYTFLIVCLIGVTLTVTAKRDEDGTSTIFGMQMRYVLTESMEECDATDVSDYDIKDIPQKSMIFVDVVPRDPVDAAEWYSDLEEGDVLTFKYVYTRQETITHRIIDIEEKKDGTGYIITLRGDNVSEDGGALTQVIDTSKSNSPNYVIGKVVGQSYFLGLLVHTLKSPAGMVCIIILPALIILFLEVLKIVRLFTRERKAKDDKAREEQQNELDELRRRLAELESHNTQSAKEESAESEAQSEPEAVEPEKNEDEAPEEKSEESSTN